jgi:hypothetical protein
MARHSGKNLMVKVGEVFIDGCVGFDITETVGSVDLTAAGDAWTDHDTTQKSFSGTISMLADHATGANQTLRSADVIAFSGYSEGNAVGKSYMSGSASVGDHSMGVSFDGAVTREYSITGKGELSIAVVTA